MITEDKNPVDGSIQHQTRHYLELIGFEPLNWFFIAGAYTALGDKERAFAWLESAYQNRDFFMTYLNVYPFLDPLHSDPRFGRLQERIGLAKESSPR